MRIYILITVLLLCEPVFSQENLWYEKNFTAYQRYFEDTYGIVITPPSECKDMDMFYVLWMIRRDKGAFPCLGNIYGPIFLSKDKECMIAYIGFISSASPKERERVGLSAKTSPRGRIIDEIKSVLDPLYSPWDSHKYIEKYDFNDYVTIIAGKEAREMFNADSIYIYDMPSTDLTCFLNESLEEKRQKKYPYCTGIVIDKNGRVPMSIKLYFTPKGVKKKQQYIEMLNKHIWYDDKFCYPDD
mgnify:CR=1 FL=1